MKKIISVVGARPNFMKVAALHKAFSRFPQEVRHMICHTGQHFDEKMSAIFFKELDLPKPDFYLGVGSGSHAEQTARIMIEFEKILLSEKPDLVIVVGDVNSTLACSLVAAKLLVPVAHVEAGLRSFDRTMPEELNRLVTDSLATFLFVTEKSGMENLRREGIGNRGQGTGNNKEKNAHRAKVFFVGQVMIDNLVHYLPKAKRSKALQQFAVEPGRYILVTFHRPSNVDEKADLVNLIDFFNGLAGKRKVIFPVHPRTLKNLEKFNLLKILKAEVLLCEPLGYIDFLALMKDAELVITDSGGIQEETTYLGIQCLTVRENTERPVTVEVGTNQLAGTDLNKVELAALKIINGAIKKGKNPQLWDGKASERIVDILMAEM
ncbi:MAG: UDP-N-acetylglucosamine 2-epimerase (non-hydrolyzing) [Chrysiogenia bacterium]